MSFALFIVGSELSETSGVSMKGSFGEGIFKSFDLLFGFFDVPFDVFEGALFDFAPFFTVGPGRNGSWFGQSHLYLATIGRASRNIKNDGTFASAILGVVAHIGNKDTVFDDPDFGSEAIDEVAVM